MSAKGASPAIDEPRHQFKNHTALGDPIIKMYRRASPEFDT